MLQRRLVLAAICALAAQTVARADTPSVQSSDTEITDRVVQRLLKTHADVARRIRVSTLNGVVTLDGTVFTLAQVSRIAAEAGRVSGVVRVKNRLHPQL